VKKNTLSPAGVSRRYVEITVRELVAEHILM
jgi:hypothetical protein